MKDNYSEMNVDMEQILLNKNYDDLTATELDEIKDFVSSKEEFNIMKNTLMNVKTSFGVEEELQPVDSAKQNLMKIFEQKHGKVIPMNKPRPFYLNPVFQIGMAALFILGIIYFYPKAENESMTAMNNTKEEESASESNDMETTEGKEESPAEESMSTADVKAAETEEVLEEESIVLKSSDKREEKKVLEDVPAFAKVDAEKNVNPKTTVNELAKGEGSDKKLDNQSESKELSELETTVYRSSTKKEKAKDSKATNDSSVDGATSVTGNTTTVTATSVAVGGIAASDELAASGKREDKDDDYKKEAGKITRTNTAGGYYMQPGKPASDLKEGVSLKDEPALSEFLFTAL